MGFLDSILGRTKPPPATIDDLFNVPQAAISLQTEGFEPLGLGSVCYRDVEGVADNRTLDEVQKVVTFEGQATVERTKDSFGFSWFTVQRPPHDVPALVTDLHAANSALVEQGFSASLLCSTVLFSYGTRRVALVYLFKRGTFYPFVSDPSANRRRDNALELRVRGIVEGDVKIESELNRWLAIWGAPGAEAP